MMNGIRWGLVTFAGCLCAAVVAHTFEGMGGAIYSGFLIGAIFAGIGAAVIEQNKL